LSVFENPVKRKMADGLAAWGASTGIAEEFPNQLTISTGVDFLWIDTEHSSYGLDDVRLLPVLARQNGCMPMIRVAGLDPNLIKKALDLGASAVMVPQVNNAEEAELAVRASKYPPQGTRGVSPLWTFYRNISWADYLPHANEEICVVVQVESPEGMANVEAIAAVEGVDVVFAGPMDLSASLGLIGQIQHPKVKEFLADFPERVKKAGKVAGISVGTAAAARESYEQGYRFIAFGSLLFAGVRGLTEDLNLLRAFEAECRAKA
jgi:4-hydroxy-2-oxoheptanedioate aldolase